MATEVGAAAPGAAQADILADADDQVSLFQSTLQSAAQPRAAGQTVSQPKPPGSQPSPQRGAQPTSADQAAEIYDKFQAGSSGDEYANQDALREIKDKYYQAMEDGQKLKGAELKAFVVKQMTDVIQGQVDHGIRVSAHSYTQDPNVVLTKDEQQKLDVIGDSFKRTDNRTIHVTSGIRTPARQAAAMYDNFQAGARVNYKNQGAFREIKDTYIQATNDGQNHGFDGPKLKAFVVKKMTDVIQGQVDRGNIISLHLTGHGVDFRTNNLTQKQKNDLEEAVTQAGGKILTEDTHLHAEFPPQRVAGK